MLRRLRNLVAPLPLSGGLTIIETIHRRSETARWYKVPIEELIQIYGDIAVRSITAAHLDDWFDLVVARNLSRWTVNSYTRAVKSYFNHMVKMGHITVSPADHLKPPRPPKATPKDITDNDIIAMLAASKRDRRDYAMICMLRDTGCRVGGLVSMTVDTLHMQETEHGKRGKILVTEKGDKSRFVFFKDETCLALIAYMEYRAAYSPPEIWLNRSDKPLTTSGVYHILRRVAKRAGVARFNPHSFRHRMCKKLVEAGTPHKVIQDMMGWSSQAMIQIYVVHTDNELQRFHELYLP